jgi:hypothetical protein
MKTKSKQNENKIENLLKFLFIKLCFINEILKQDH